MANNGYTNEINKNNQFQTPCMPFFVLGMINFT